MVEARALARLDDVTLSYLERGSGKPVLLVHAGVLADWFQPLLAEPALVERYRLVSYHRANYGESSHVSGPLSVADQAEHARRLLQHLGIERAHVVGHSAGAAVALQLAADHPGLIQTLTVMDAALSEHGNPPARSGDSASGQPLFMREAADLLAAGRADLAVDAFMRNVCGPAYRAVVDRVLPGAFEQAVADADGLFHQEIPALLAWHFGLEDARRITCPVLAVAGGESPPVFAQRQQRLLAWLPNAEAFTLPSAGHLLMLEQPRALAEALAAFLARHPP
jgi:pimeloyl-ACP methyl ester carboxylesterase